MTQCHDCSPEEACGKYHVYVIELDQLVIDADRNDKFSQANPGYEPGHKCFYVGSTAHTVECRFEQHKRHAEPENVDFPCDCFGEYTRRFFLGRHPKGGNRGNKYAGKYGLALAPEFLPEVSVFDTRDDAEAREESLADELRTDGHAVWQK